MPWGISVMVGEWWRKHVASMAKKETREMSVLVLTWLRYLIMSASTFFSFRFILLVTLATGFLFFVFCIFGFFFS